jgi:histidinol-phosphate/aromatic aminotransferase/cobyric acid decarboxylase-like protein
MIHGHGGNIFDAALSLGCRPDDILDMSSNFNPLGPSPELMEMLQSRLGTINRLPEVDAGRLGAEYARIHGCRPHEVLAGGGTTQFIYQLPRALKIRRALICGPTYADYRVIRDCANFKGLSEKYVRVSLKDRPANTQFVERFRQILGLGGPGTDFYPDD